MNDFSAKVLRNSAPEVAEQLGRKVDRRTFLLRSAALVGLSVPLVGGLLSACGDDDVEPDIDAATEGDDDQVDDSDDLEDEEAPDEEAPDEEPDVDDDEEDDETDDDAPADRTGGELIIATGADSYRTEPNRANIGKISPNTNIFDTLVRLDPDYQVEPMLAESWEFVEPNTWRFDLREDVTFHDGTPFTAEAVHWTMHRVAEYGGGILGVDNDSTEVIDDYTVEITPARTNLRVIEQVGHPSYSIVAPDTEVADERIGTGPFREVEYVPEDRHVVEANEDYWGDQPGVDRIVFRFVPDATTRVLQLQAEEVDIALDVPRESAQEVGEMDGLEIVNSEVGTYSAIYVNIHGEEPYDLGQEREVREALAYALDKESIVDGVWRGNAEVNNTMIPTAILGPAGDAVAGTTYDPERASQILEEAGWVEGNNGIRERDGRELRLTMVVGFPSAEIHNPMPEFAQSQLLDVGIDLEIVQTPDLATYEARLQTLEGDLWVEAGNQNDGNPCFLPDLLFYSPDEAGDPESAMYGNAFSLGEEFDQHIDACREATSIEEVQEAASLAMQLLIDEERIVIPIAGIFRIYGIRDRVQGFEAHPSGANQRWTGITIAD